MPFNYSLGLSRKLNFFKPAKAFTLAEVLITLGVIGIVAAMTMPALVGKYQEKVLISQAKKSLAIIQNALIMTKAKEEASANGDFFRSENTHDETADILFKNMQVIERCYSNKKGCGYNTKYKQQKRKNDGYGNVMGPSIMNNFSRAVLKDGSIIGVVQTKYPEGSCQNYYKTYDRDANGNYILDSDGNRTGERIVPEVDCGHIFFDVNGVKGPNQYGRDVFLIYIVPNGYIQSLGLINNVLKTGRLDYDKFTEGEKFK